MSGNSRSMFNRKRTLFPWAAPAVPHSTEYSTRQQRSSILRHGLQVEGAEDGRVLDLRGEGSGAAAGLARAARAPAAALAPALAPARRRLPQRRLQRRQPGQRLLLAPAGVRSVLDCTATSNTAFTDTRQSASRARTPPPALFSAIPSTDYK